MLTPFLLFASLLIVLVFLYRAHAGAGLRNPAVWLAGYTAVIGIAAYRGAFADGSHFPPPVMAAVVGGIGWAIAALAFGRVVPGQEGIRALLGVSVARLVVEQMLLHLAAQGLVPVMMTWEGTNFDILSGLGAVLLLAYGRRHAIPTVALRIWNVGGLALLLNVVVTAFLSLPSPLQQINFGHPNVAILMFPYTLLPAVIVPAVIYTHLRLFGVGRK